jgi:hypothetical protein
MPQSRNAPGESFGHYFLGTFVSNDIEQTAVVVISLAGIEVFRKRATHGVDWIGERAAIEEAFRDFATEIATGLRVARNRSAR